MSSGRSFFFGNMNSSRHLPSIVVFSGNPPGWRWFAPDTQDSVNWIFYSEEPETWLERKISKPKLSRIFGAFRSVRRAQRESADAIAAHSQFNTFWCAVALRLLRARVPLLSFSFHFPRLPRGARKALLQWALQRVERFTVHSEPERERYARHFELPVERFELIRWGVRPSTVEGATESPVSGRYICAIGKDGRDYATLIRAMERLPDVTLVVVAQPWNLSGVAIPDNVKVYCNIPSDLATGILRGCVFMALPLESGETSCGHITIVSAMFCRKAIVATDSSGIADYFPEGYEAPRVRAGDVNGWVQAIRKMMADPDCVERCGAIGEGFAHRCCSHEVTCRNTMEVFRRAGLPVAEESALAECR